MSKCGWCGSPVNIMLDTSTFIQFKLKYDTLCLGCREKLISLTVNTTCIGCNRIQEQHGHCRDCLMWQKSFPNYQGVHHALYSYSPFAKEIIERFKFTGDCATAELFKEDIKSYFKRYSKHHLIIPIPLSVNSLESRGFNQTELLLEAADVKFTQVFENKYQTEKQSRKNRAERLRTTQPFVVREEEKLMIKGKDIILADDIYTTGRTIYHAVEALEEYEPASVNSFSLFR